MPLAPRSLRPTVLARLALAALLALLPAVAAAQPPAGKAKGRERGSGAGEARIVTSDIPRFWRAFDRLATARTRADSVRAFAEEYYAKASPGLEEFLRARVGSPELLLRAVARRPRYYRSIRAGTLALARLEPELRRQMRRFEELYPRAVFPDVYLLIGSFRTGGITTPQGLLIGTELRTRAPGSPLEELTAWERANVAGSDELACIVMHELAHAQQRPPRDSSLLAMAVYEGGAEFVASRVCGRVKRALHEWGDRNERPLWRAFARQMEGRSYALWLYNGGRITDRPSDLGYYVGFRIAEAYFSRARDERRAIADILGGRSARALLRASGYAERWQADTARSAGARRRVGEGGRGRGAPLLGLAPSR